MDLSATDGAVIFTVVLMLAFATAMVRYAVELTRR